MAIRFLQNDVVAIPTETVYGLAANAFSPDLVARIFEVKNRPVFDPLIVHVADLKQAESLVLEFPNALRELALRFWPGPLTLLLRKNEKIPDIVTSGLDRVGIRVPNHPLALKLLRELTFPLAAPSANPFGYISPSKPEHVEEQLGPRIPMILDGGQCSIGLESTIIGLEEGIPVVYRLGGIAAEKIIDVLGDVKFKTESGSNPGAPGMLLSHYAPRKPLFLQNQIQVGADAFYIRYRQALPDYPKASQYILSESGDLHVAAVHLFEALHLAEKHPESTIIYAETVPDEGIGRAINDRLQRASFPRNDKE